jgi:hypothetical protein
MSARAGLGCRHVTLGGRHKAHRCAVRRNVHIATLTVIASAELDHRRQGPRIDHEERRPVLREH